MQGVLGEQSQEAAHGSWSGLQCRDLGLPEPHELVPSPADRPACLGRLPCSETTGSCSLRLSDHEVEAQGDQSPRPRGQEGRSRGPTCSGVFISVGSVVPAAGSCVSHDLTAAVASSRWTACLLPCTHICRGRWWSQRDPLPPAHARSSSLG